MGYGTPTKPSRDLISSLHAQGSVGSRAAQRSLRDNLLTGEECMHSAPCADAAHQEQLWYSRGSSQHHLGKVRNPAAGDSHLGATSADLGNLSACHAVIPGALEALQDQQSSQIGVVLGVPAWSPSAPPLLGVAVGSWCHQSGRISRGSGCFAGIKSASTMPSGERGTSSVSTGPEPAPPAEHLATLQWHSGCPALQAAHHTSTQTHGYPPLRREGAADEANCVFP